MKDLGWSETEGYEEVVRLGPSPPPCSPLTNSLTPPSLLCALCDAGEQDQDQVRGRRRPHRRREVRLRGRPRQGTAVRSNESNSRHTHFRYEACEFIPKTNTNPCQIKHDRHFIRLRGRPRQGTVHHTIQSRTRSKNENTDSNHATDPGQSNTLPAPP